MKTIQILKGLLLIAIIAWSYSCKSSKTSTTVDDNSKTQEVIRQTIEEYFTKEDSVEIIPNEQGNRELYVSNKTLSTSEPVNEVKFLVYDLSDKRVLYENQFSRSNVKWFDNKTLLLTKHLGIVDKETGKGFIQYLIDIETDEMKEYTATKKN